LKIEPKEADVWAMPSPDLVLACTDALRAIKQRVAAHLENGALLGAVAAVDRIILGASDLSARQIENIRQARAELAQRRTTRAASGR
jgi:hypothetical protein